MRVGTSFGGQHMVDTVRTRRTHYEVLGLKPAATGDEIAQRVRERKWARFRPHSIGGLTEVTARPRNLARSRQTPGLRCLARPPARSPEADAIAAHGRASATPPSVARRSRPASSRSPIRSRRPLPVPSRRPLPVPSSSRLLPTHRRQSRRWSHSFDPNRSAEALPPFIARSAARAGETRAAETRPPGSPGRSPRHRRNQRRARSSACLGVAIFAPRWTSSWPRPRKGRFHGANRNCCGRPGHVRRARRRLGRMERGR